MNQKKRKRKKTKRKERIKMKNLRKKLNMMNQKGNISRNYFQQQEMKNQEVNIMHHMQYQCYLSS